MAERAAKGTYSEDEVAAAIAIALEGRGFAHPVQEVVRDLLLHLPDSPEPKAAEEATRMIVLVDGQS